jgi:hypothetical protein
MKTVLTAAFAACLVACGGGGGDPAPTQTQSACQDSVTVQMYGDSTQDRAFRFGNLQHELDTRFGTGRVFLINQAVGGTDSTQLVAGTDKRNPPWPQNVSGDILMMKHGANDAWRHIPIGTFSANLRLFAQQKPIVLETPNPWNHAAVSPDVDETPPYADAIRAVGEEMGVPVADTRAYVLSLPGWGAMLDDGVHQTPELDALVAKNVTAPALAPIIASMLCAR